MYIWNCGSITHRKDIMLDKHNQLPSLKLTASAAKPNMTEWTYQCNLPLLQGQQHLMAIRCKACFGVASMTLMFCKLAASEYAHLMA